VGFGGVSAASDNQVETTWKMLDEEIQELQDANSDLEIIDAVADIFVVNSQLLGIYEETLSTQDLRYASSFKCRDVSEYLRKVRIILRSKDKPIAASLAMAYWTKMADFLEQQGFDVGGALEEVTASNNSKFPTIKDLKSRYGEELSSEELITKEQDWIRENKRKYSSVVGHVSDHFLHSQCEPDLDLRHIVFRESGGTGKIVKPSTFFEPELEKYTKN